MLSLIIWMPILFSFLILVIKSEKQAFLIAVFASSVTTLLSLYVFYKFQDTYIMQFTEFYSWIPELKINYHLGIDGFSILFLILNNIITLLVVIAAKDKNKSSNALFLIMNGAISGVFSALDAMLFYVFFEAMLIPMYLIIGIWGGKNRVYATMKFFLYTMFGSLLLLIALLYLTTITNSFEISSYYNLSLPPSTQLLLFLAFFIAFAVKIPMWPFHTWLPDAHPEAPTGGSVVLAAMTLKVGGYGLLRFILPIFSIVHDISPVMIGISLISIVYIGFVAIAQTDIKKLIAYSSIAHMGFVSLGCFLFVDNKLNAFAIEGAIIQMISHGFISAAMFFAVGMMYERVHTRNIHDITGIAKTMPIFATFFMFFSMANASLPGTSAFVGEFMIMMASINYSIVVGLIAGLSVVLTAGYTLLMYKRVVFGKANALVLSVSDVSKKETSILLVLAIYVLMIGLVPNIITAKLHATVQHLISITI